MQLQKLWVLLLLFLCGCSQTVAIQGHLQVTPAGQAIDPKAPGLSGFQTGSADVKLAVAPDTKVVSALTLQQGKQQQKIAFDGLNWGQDALALQLTAQQLNGSVRLNWQHDSQPQTRQQIESCTFAGWCHVEVEREVEQCEIQQDKKVCTRYTEIRLEYDYHPACPGLQQVAITEQYSHALLNLYLNDQYGSRLEFSGKSQSDLFELDRQIVSSCR